ncbi:hypothetical protein FH972_024036 [Carpinus fangiana]|uniref:Uncharacterized protein n=1 Tax=Carpinus fangiana TaxID=176857 RepID=A0A5N6KWV6_9ROSI|nr:hypothetical protein FH972_024036 [Carpinus fangiana]
MAEVVTLYNTLPTLEDELMLATGNVSQPISVHAHGGEIYPERWLKDGTAFEFTTKFTKSPPSDLLRDFQSLIGTNTSLGLYYAGGQGPKDKPVLLERTEGRRNITDPVRLEDLPPGSVQTAWLPSGINPVQMACTITCDTRTTRSPGVKHHKNTKTHGTT